MYTFRRWVLTLVFTFGTSACGFHSDRSIEELAPRYANTHSRIVTVEGMQVHYRDQGSGPALLLLHGSNAWSYALAYPQKVDKLILIASRGIPPAEDLPFAFKAYSTPLHNRALTVFSPRWLTGSSLRDAYGDPTKVTEETIDRYFELNLRAGNREATLYRMTHLDTYEDLPRLATITVPTLILWGERDRWILPKYAAQFAAKLPQAEVILYPELGHLPMEEAPERTAADARRFLQGGTVGGFASPERDRPRASPPS